jgi:hypothetical protein
MVVVDVRISFSVQANRRLGTVEITEKTALAFA